MPALTPEQEALKAAAQDLENEPGESFGNKVQVVNRYHKLASPTAILAILAQLEAQEAPTSGDIILCGCMPADLGYTPPKLEWEEAPSVPEQAGTDQQAGGESAPQPAESRMDTGLQAGGQVAARGASTLPSTPLPGSAQQGGEQDDDVKESGRGGRYVPVAIRDALREEVIDLHRQLAAEKLRADQGWERYEAANRSRQATENQLAALRQPAQPIPDVLFEGYAVYEEVRRKAGHMRTSPENVSDVLDAVVRLIRAAKAAPGELGQ